MNQDVEAVFRSERTPNANWVVIGATIVSRLNDPYLVQLDLRTSVGEVEPLELLGGSAELATLFDDEENVYAGVVSSVRSIHDEHGAVAARVTLEPALCALRHGRDTRIFQEKTVPEILEEVLGADLGAYGRSVRLELSRDYPAREYTVQYQESDFEFVHRLMEEEGIVYYFEAEGEAEVMVLLDEPSQHPEVADPLLDFSLASGDAGERHETVRAFRPISRVVGTKVATRHFDWTHPSALIGAESEPSGEDEIPNGAWSGPERESYEHDEPLTLHGYGGAYTAHDSVAKAALRREAQARGTLVFDGTSTVRRLRAGSRFDLNGHPDVTLNASYLVVEIRHHLLDHVGRTGGESTDQGQRYANRFIAAPAATPWRPQRLRPRPRIRGIQTAIVTGPPGEEIHCDEHGRVKVQFHWDRVGGYDDHSSCWMRVMQTSAGAGFGAFVLPRVGMEVVVSFVDGDPDRPLVTGCVYNGDNPVPYDMPAQKARTLFKSNTYPGGGGYNELRLDDTKDAEEIWLHGQKDWNTKILNDLNREVDRDETQHVGNDRTRTVGHDETLTVINNRTRQVHQHEVVTIGLTRTETVGVNETLTVGVNRIRNVGAMETVSIGGNQTLTIVGSRTTSIGVDDTLNVANDRTVSVANNHTFVVGVGSTAKVGGDLGSKVGGDLSETVKKNRTRAVGGVETITVAAARMLNVGAAHTVTVGGVMRTTVGVAFEIVCGDSKLRMDAGGKITITGTEFEFVASGEVRVGGSMIHLN